MAAIRDRIERRHARWVQAMWDPILVEHHGVTFDEAGEQGLKVDVSDYRIPLSQHVQISGWMSRQRGFALAWVGYGPGSFQDKGGDAADG